MTRQPAPLREMERLPIRLIACLPLLAAINATRPVVEKLVAGPTTSTVCVTMSVVSSSFTVSPFTMHWWNRDDWSSKVYIEIRQQAAKAGAALTDAEPHNSITDHTVTTCAAFASPDDIAKLQPWLQQQMDGWLNWFLGDCYAFWLPYTFQVSITSSGGSPLAPNLRLETAPFKCSSLPQPPATFPAPKCDRRPGITPFAVDPLIYILDGRNEDSSQYCFRVNPVVPVDSESPCAKASTLYKAEIWVDEAQRDKVRAVAASQPWDVDYLDLQYASPEWGSRGDQTLTVTTSLRWDRGQAIHNPVICMELDWSLDIQSLCLTGRKTCWISLLDESGECCPVFAAGPEDPTSAQEPMSL